MSELENTNPTMDNPGDNQSTPSSETNAQSTMPEQQGADYSQLFSENIAENNSNQSGESTADVQPNVQEAISQPVNQPDEAPAQQETVNIEQEIAHTSLDNHQSQEAIEAQKARVEQQKLAWLKEHEKKAKKS